METTERTKLRRLVAWIDSRLVKTHGEPEPRPRGEPLDGLIATILSQNTSDTNSGRAYDAMRAAFPTWEDVMNAPRRQLENVLKPGGLAKIKAARIQRILKAIAETGSLSLNHIKKMTNEEAEAYLLGFDGVGYKTVRCVLMFELGRDVFPIDTHVYRILTRMGVIPEGMNADRAHVYVPQFIPKGRCYPLHINLIRHGRRICYSKNPECGQCSLRARCGFWKAVEGAH
jgi:endonuclease III